MKKWLFGLGVLAVITVVVLVATGNMGTRAAGNEPEPTLAPVKADTSVLADGAVVPARVAVLSFPTGGIVAEVLVAEGDTVTAGQPLVRLDAARQRASVAQAEAVLAGS